MNLSFKEACEHPLYLTVEMQSEPYSTQYYPQVNKYSQLVNGRESILDVPGRPSARLPQLAPKFAILIDGNEEDISWLREKDKGINRILQIGDIGIRSMLICRYGIVTPDLRFISDLENPEKGIETLEIEIFDEQRRAFSKEIMDGFTPGAEIHLGIQKTEYKKLVRVTLMRPQKDFKRLDIPPSPIRVEMSIDPSVHNRGNFQQLLKTPLYLLSN